MRAIRAGGVPSPAHWPLGHRLLKTAAGGSSARRPPGTRPGDPRQVVAHIGQKPYALQILIGAVVLRPAPDVLGQITNLHERPGRQQRGYVPIEPSVPAPHTASHRRASTETTSEFQGRVDPRLRPVKSPIEQQPSRVDRSAMRTTAVPTSKPSLMPPMMPAAYSSLHERADRGTIGRFRVSRASVTARLRRSTPGARVSRLRRCDRASRVHQRSREPTWPDR